MVEATNGNIKALLRRGRGCHNLNYLLLKAAHVENLQKCAIYAGCWISGISWVSAILAAEAGRRQVPVRRRKSRKLRRTKRRPTTLPVRASTRRRVDTTAFLDSPY
jgi:hypothetical protein